MPTIKIIQATPGPKTTERLLNLLQNYPEGITMRKLSQQLNRPVSMVNICLKNLISAKQVNVKLSKNGMQRLYIPA